MIVAPARNLAWLLQYGLRRANPARPVGWRANRLTNFRYGDFKMVRFPTLVATAFAVCITTAAYAHAAPATTEIASDMGQPLTLTSAKKMVSDKLAAAGQRAIQPGHAEFDANGNVRVDLVDGVGLTVGHMIVHANDGMVTDANAGKKVRG
jgi:hypothetical protein